MQLERYEWCDYWWEQANKRDKERVLLIGDSITKSYHPFVNELLKEKVYVDMLATSKAVDNPFFIREIDYIITHGEFEYQVIHINNGLHGWHLSTDEYEQGYDQALNYLIEHAEQAQIVIGLTTPVTKAGTPDEICPKINDQVLARNRAAERLAKKYDHVIHDLYSLMMRHSKYRVDDGYHYHTEGQKVQAKSVAETIIPLLRKRGHK